MPGYFRISLTANDEMVDRSVDASPPPTPGPPAPGETRGERVDPAAFKRAVVEEVDRHRRHLIEVRTRSTPTRSWRTREHFAHELLTSALEDAGLRVDRMPMASTRLRRSGRCRRPLVRCCGSTTRSRARPGCGHNVIAAAAWGPAWRRRRSPGRPAAGSWCSAPRLRSSPQGNRHGRRARSPGSRRRSWCTRPAPTCARWTPWPLLVTRSTTRLSRPRRGRPEHGRNALDAAVLGYTAVAALRQHILRTERIHVSSPAPATGRMWSPRTRPPSGPAFPDDRAARDLEPRCWPA